MPFIAVALAGFALLAAFVLRYMRRTAVAIAAGESQAAPSRHARSALRPAQPHLLRRAAGGGDRRGARRLIAGRGVLYRPRPFQGRQRHARPSGRRRTDPQRHAAAVAHAARRRSGGAARRRRIRGDLLDRRRQRQDDGAGAAHHRRDLRALLDQRPEHRDRRLDRHRGDRPRMRRRRRHHALCRHGALPRQERGPQPRLHLRRGDGCRPVEPQAARRRPARGDRERPACRCCTSRSSTRAARPWSASRRCAAGRTRPAAKSRRSNSSPSPSTAA